MDEDSLPKSVGMPPPIVEVPTISQSIQIEVEADSGISPRPVQKMVSNMSFSSTANNDAIIDMDDDDMEQDNSSELSGASSTERCDQCDAMLENVRKAHESATRLGNQLLNHGEIIKQNDQLRRINAETSNYVQEILKNNQNFEVLKHDLEGNLERERVRNDDLQKQMSQLLTKAREGQKHLEAVNEWRAKYDISQETLMEVDESRRELEDKYTQSVNVAKKWREKHEKAVAKIEKGEVSLKTTKTKLNGIGKHIPALLSIVDEIANLDRSLISPATRRKIEKFNDPALRAVLMGRDGAVTSTESDDDDASAAALERMIVSNPRSPQHSFPELSDTDGESESLPSGSRSQAVETRRSRQNSAVEDDLLEFKERKPRQAHSNANRLNPIIKNNPASTPSNFPQIEMKGFGGRKQTKKKQPQSNKDSAPFAVPEVTVPAPRTKDVTSTTGHVKFRQIGDVGDLDLSSTPRSSVRHPNRNFNSSNALTSHKAALGGKAKKNTGKVAKFEMPDIIPVTSVKTDGDTGGARSIHGKKTVSIREQQAKMNVAERIKVLKKQELLSKTAENPTEVGEESASEKSSNSKYVSKQSNVAILEQPSETQESPANVSLSQSESMPLDDDFDDFAPFGNFSEPSSSFAAPEPPHGLSASELVAEYEKRIPNLPTVPIVNSPVKQVQKPFDPNEELRLSEDSDSDEENHENAQHNDAKLTDVPVQEVETPASSSKQPSATSEIANKPTHCLQLEQERDDVVQSMPSLLHDELAKTPERTSNDSSAKGDAVTPSRPLSLEIEPISTTMEALQAGNLKETEQTAGLLKRPVSLHDDLMMTPEKDTTEDLVADLTLTPSPARNTRSRTISNASSVASTSEDVFKSPRITRRAITRTLSSEKTESPVMNLRSRSATPSREKRAGLDVVKGRTSRARANSSLAATSPALSNVKKEVTSTVPIKTELTTPKPIRTSSKNQKVERSATTVRQKPPISSESSLYTPDSSSTGKTLNEPVSSFNDNTTSTIVDEMLPQFEKATGTHSLRVVDNGKTLSVRPKLATSTQKPYLPPEASDSLLSDILTSVKSSLKTPTKPKRIPSRKPPTTEKRLPDAVNATPVVEASVVSESSPLVTVSEQLNLSESSDDEASPSNVESAKSPIVAKSGRPKKTAFIKLRTMAVKKSVNTKKDEDKEAEESSKADEQLGVTTDNREKIRKAANAAQRTKQTTSRTRRTQPITDGIEIVRPDQVIQRIDKTDPRALRSKNFKPKELKNEDEDSLSKSASSLTKNLSSKNTKAVVAATPKPVEIEGPPARVTTRARPLAGIKKKSIEKPITSTDSKMIGDLQSTTAHTDAEINEDDDYSLLIDEEECHDDAQQSNNADSEIQLTISNKQSTGKHPDELYSDLISDSEPEPGSCIIVSEECEPQQESSSSEEIQTEDIRVGSGAEDIRVGSGAEDLHDESSSPQLENVNTHESCESDFEDIPESVPLHIEMNSDAEEVEESLETVTKAVDEKDMDESEPSSSKLPRIAHTKVETTHVPSEMSTAVSESIPQSSKGIVTAKPATLLPRKRPPPSAPKTTVKKSGGLAALRSRISGKRDLKSLGKAMTDASKQVNIRASVLSKPIAKPVLQLPAAKKAVAVRKTVSFCDSNSTNDDEVEEEEQKPSTRIVRTPSATSVPKDDVVDDKPIGETVKRVARTPTRLSVTPSPKTTPKIRPLPTPKSIQSRRKSNENAGKLSSERAAKVAGRECQVSETQVDETSISAKIGAKRTAVMIDLPSSAPKRSKAKSSLGGARSSLESILSAVSKGTSVEGALRGVDTEKFLPELGAALCARVICETVNTTHVGDLWTSVRTVLTSSQDTNTSIKQLHSVCRAKVETAIIEVVNQLDANDEGDLFEQVFRQLAILITQQPSCTVAQLSRNVRVAVYILWFHPGLLPHVKIQMTRQLFEFLIRERTGECVLQSVFYILLGQPGKLLEWLKTDEGAEKERRLLRIHLTGRPDTAHAYSLALSNLNLQPATSDEVMFWWSQGVELMDRKSTMGESVEWSDGKISFNSEFSSELLWLASSISHKHRLELDRTHCFEKLLLGETLSWVDAWTSDGDGTGKASMFADMSAASIGGSFEGALRVAARFRLLSLMVDDTVTYAHNVIRYQIMHRIRNSVEEFNSISLRLNSLLSRSKHSDTRWLEILGVAIRNWLELCQNLTKFNIVSPEDQATQR